MPHPDQRVRTVRRLAPVLLLGLALPALSACAGGEGDRPPVSGHAAPAARPVTVTHAMPSDITDVVLPASGTDSRWTQGLDALPRQAADEVTRRCVASHGAAMPAQPPVSFIRYSDVPDLGFIAGHGFDAVPVPGASDAAPAAGSPAAAAASGPDATQRTCLTRGATAAADFRKSYLSLQNQWWQAITSLKSSPEASAAFGGFSDCLARHEVRAKDESAFFDLVDERLQAGDTKGNRSLGATYAACMKPVESARVPLRERLRDGFRKEHREEIEKMRSELPREIRELEQRYGIRISFPAP
ncbi:hypothetical protein ACICHK_33585 [Streptomyces sp. AHU1]|uniref:hypothetical protein n=1 Tax=Streptomyces sp. AHU1 TaxID=3377215 RepID=UPI0038783616